MNDASTANIKQIITAFHNIISIYENDQWVKTVTSEDIKVAFKLGAFVEKAMCKFREQNSASHFLKGVKTWENYNTKVDYEEEFYAKVCDHLLLKFFKHKFVNENVIDVAVRMYTSLFPKERLEVVLKDLIMTSACFEAIFDFTVANKPIVNIGSVKYELVLQQWSKDFECDNKKIVSLVADWLTSYKVQTCLPTFMGILALNVKNSVTKVILDGILEKMWDRSILSKNFWLAMFRNVESCCLLQVCCNYKEFFEPLCNFLIYVGGMMEQNNKNQWISNSSTSICPEISYNELETIFKCLCQSENLGMKEYVISRLSEAQECTDLSIWELIMHACL
ncbi:uncharacterized protein LOC135128709 isoform X1 [Zophobas morio]|uniref:uncharacterized protein LOC135128709 isoform X1 n=1 Tax=Zophobas morio TaxID=2755281 RepID=UPI0030829EFB